MRGWFRIDRTKMLEYEYPDNIVYAFVMSRVNYGKPSKQMDVPVVAGQCVLTQRLIARKAGLRSLTAVRNSLQRIGCLTEPVTSSQCIGRRALRITVPGVEKTTSKTTNVPRQSEEAQQVKVTVEQPIRQPKGQHVLESTYEKTTYLVAEAIGVMPTPGLQAEVQKVGKYTEKEILGSVNAAYSEQPPRSSVPGWFRTIVVPTIERAHKDAQRPEFQRPKPLPPPVSAEETAAGIAQLRKALDNGSNKQDISSG